MKKVTNIYVNIDSLASCKEATPTEAERENLTKLLEMLEKADFAMIEVTRPDDTQNSPQYSAGWQGTPVSSSTNRAAYKSFPNWSTEKKKAIAERLRPQTRALRHSVQGQVQKTPIRLRTYDPRFVYNLLSQVETLLGDLDAYVFPLLEPTDSSKY